MKPEAAADPAAVRKAALDLLARREHSAQELARKLAVRGYHGDAVADALAALAAEGLQSDARFAEQFVWSRFQRGAGPQKIRAELAERGVDAALIEHAIESLAEDWQDLLREVREKKFGTTIPDDFRERGRQMRFLQQRGFTAEQIRRVFRDDE